MEDLCPAHARLSRRSAARRQGAAARRRGGAPPQRCSSPTVLSDSVSATEHARIRFSARFRSMPASAAKPASPAPRVARYAAPRGGPRAQVSGWRSTALGGCRSARWKLLNMKFKVYSPSLMPWAVSEPPVPKTTSSASSLCARRTCRCEDPQKGSDSHRLITGSLPIESAWTARTACGMRPRSWAFSSPHATRSHSSAYIRVHKAVLAFPWRLARLIKVGRSILPTEDALGTVAPGVKSPERACKWQPCTRIPVLSCAPSTTRFQPRSASSATHSSRRHMFLAACIAVPSTRGREIEAILSPKAPSRRAAAAPESFTGWV